VSKKKLALQSGAKQKALSTSMGSRHTLQSLVPNPGTKGFPLLSGLKDFHWAILEKQTIVKILQKHLVY